MLLDGHKLNGVVTVLGYAGQDVLPELIVGSDTLLILGHAYVGLVDQQRFRIGRKPSGFEPVRMLGVIDLGRKYLGVFVLNHARGICRDTLPFAAVPEHPHLEEIAVVDHVLAEFSLPGAVFEPRQGIALVVLPVGERTDQQYLGRIGEIVAECPSVTAMMQSEVFICVGELLKRAAGVGGKFVELTQHILVTPLDGRRMRLKPRIVAQYRKFPFLCLHMSLSYICNFHVVICFQFRRRNLENILHGFAYAARVVALFLQHG